MREHGLFDAGWTYDFAKRLTGYMADGSPQNALAICDYRKRQLVFKKSYVFWARESELEQTILHEIAHYYVRRGGHRQAWLDKAREIGYTREWLPEERQDDDFWNSRSSGSRFFAKYSGVIDDVAKTTILVGILYLIFDFFFGRFPKR